MLHFDANPITIGYLVTEFYEGFYNAKNNIKQRDLNTVFLKNNIPDIRLIPLDHVTYVN